jgi:hypothetical protein
LGVPAVNGHVENGVGSKKLRQGAGRLLVYALSLIKAFLLKHNFPKMFAPLFIYSIAGCFEFLCLALWTLLSVFWNTT